MKIGFKILIIFIAMLAFTGFAMADRLPSQVPENQQISIQTIIDCVGMVSDSSSMQWVLDDQNSKYNALERSSTDGAPIVLTAKQIADLTAAGVKVVADSSGAVEEIQIPDSLLYASDDYAHSLPASITNPALGLVSYDDLYNYVYASGQFESTTKTDEGQIHDSKLNPSESIMLMTWTDSIRTNGGHLSLNKNIDFDSKNKADGMSNLQVEKVLTYESIEGSHLNGAESYTLDVAGNYANADDNIRCVFASASSDYLPAFCNVVKAQSELINVNSAQISTKGSVRGVAATADVPAALSYQIAVTPDSNSGSGFADGTVKTKFSGSIMEARQNHQSPSATNTWKDEASVSGGIKNFQKTLNYQSGFSY